jgi:hypothetical protein
VYGTVGGFLDNCTQNVSVLLDHLAKRLSAEDGMAQAVQRAKFIYARVAEPPKIDGAGRTVRLRCGSARRLRLMRVVQYARHLGF